MSKATEFFAAMLDNLDASARSLDRPEYGAQTVESCQALYDLCLEMNPDFVVDVGTAAGASCLALAYALQALGKKSVRHLITICIHQGRWWDQGIAVNEKLAKLNGIGMRDIRIVEKDFRDVLPGDHIFRGDSVFLFYDIHDRKKDPSPVLPSQHLIKNWLPQISAGTVVIHDVFKEKVRPYLHPLARAEHWSLGQVYGQKEVVPIVDYLNNEKAELFEVPSASLVYFRVEDGRPL